MPSWPLELTITPTPLATVEPKMPATNVPVCVPGLPMRIMFPIARYPTLPMSMLLPPVVRLRPALMPSAMLLLPVVVLLRAP